MNSKKAEDEQNKIYRKMPAGKKIKITSQLISLAKKLKQSNDRRKTSK